MCSSRLLLLGFELVSLAVVCGVALTSLLLWRHTQDVDTLAETHAALIEAFRAFSEIVAQCSAVYLTAELTRDVTCAADTLAALALPL